MPVKKAPKKSAPQKQKASKKVRIATFSVWQNSKFLGACYFILMIPFSILLALVALSTPKDSGNPMMHAPLFMALLPFIYAILGFFCAALGCVIYNWLASYPSLGGIEITVAED